MLLWASLRVCSTMKNNAQAGRVAFAVLFCLVFAGLGFIGGYYFKQWKVSSKPTKAQRNSSSLSRKQTAEQHPAVLQMLQTFFTKRGDSYFAVNKQDNLLIEAKGFDAEAVDLTSEADRLNGYTWTGLIELRIAAMRQRSPLNDWSRWTETTASYRLSICHAELKDDEWMLRYSYFRKPTDAELPPE